MTGKPAVVIQPGGAVGEPRVQPAPGLRCRGPIPGGLGRGGNRRLRPGGRSARATPCRACGADPACRAGARAPGSAARGRDRLRGCVRRLSGTDRDPAVPACRQLGYLPVGELIRSDTPGTFALALRKPLGEVAGISPWNGAHALAWSASLRRSGCLPAGAVHRGAGHRLSPRRSLPGIIWTAVTAAAMFLLAARRRGTARPDAERCAGLGWADPPPDTYWCTTRPARSGKSSRREVRPGPALTDARTGGALPRAMWLGHAVAEPGAGGGDLDQAVCTWRSAHPGPGRRT